jgi:hypothetical protein
MPVVKDVFDAILALLSTPGAIIILFILLLLVASRLGWIELKGPAGLGATRKPPSSDPAIDVRAARLDLNQYAEVATALPALVEAMPAQVEAAARHWFSELATRLATRLKEERDHHYRVAIWLDDPNYPDRFLCVGLGLFDKDDIEMEFLERKYTIGGLAFNSSNMYYYCHDRRTDANFKPRKTIPPAS